MNSTLGNLFVLAGLAFAASGAVIGIGSGLTRRPAGYVWTLRATWAFFAAMLLANLTMVYALLTHDFSVQYVAQVGSKATPLLFTIVSLWSSLEGSILFWGLILGTYLLAFSLLQRKEQPRAVALSLGRDARGGHVLRVPDRRARRTRSATSTRRRSTAPARTRCSRTTS